MKKRNNSIKPTFIIYILLRRFAPKQGIEDLTVHDFKLLLGVDIQITLSKADRMIYGESAMTHAMTFTAVSCEVSFKSPMFLEKNN